MKKSTLITATVTLLASAGIAVAAGNGMTQNHTGQTPPKIHHKSGDSLPRGFDKLNLSQTQKNKIQEIMKSARPTEPKRPQNQVRGEEFRQKAEQFQARNHALLTAKNFDEQAARRIIAERQQERNAMEQQQTERELNMLKTRHAIFQVLTPVQQQQYLAQQKERREHGFGQPNRNDASARTGN